MAIKNNPHLKKGVCGISWFTLVELIVTITILAILGTIAFTTFSGYSGNARDGSRSSDLANISQALDIAFAKNGSYPSPDNSFTVSYSWGALWYQWTVGNSVVNILDTQGAKISKKPTDPLAPTKEYTYSKLAYGNAYQIKADWEGDSVLSFQRDLRNFTIPQVYAASGNPTLSYIKGNYNGVVAKTQTGGMVHVLSAPSLFVNSSTGTVILPTATATGFYLQGQTNSGWTLFSPSLVYSSGSLPSNDSERVLLASGIALAYSGTSLATNPQIQSLITALASPTNTGTLASLGGYAVVNWLGGSTGGNTVTCNSNGFITATGGIVTIVGNYKIHTFTSVGTGSFQVMSGSGNIDYLVVGGGGGGGGSSSGNGTYNGAGGAGGMLTGTVSSVCGKGYAVKVGNWGAGGVGVANTGIANGEDSILDTVTAYGGGKGGYYSTGGAGGSGGGGGNGGNGGAGFAWQGYSGGGSTSSQAWGSGGGGGAGGGGITGTTGGGGAGGAGLASNISGSSVTYAGGGGGTEYWTTNESGASKNNGGTGGGGAGARGNGNGFPGTNGLGGGGGCGGAQGPGPAAGVPYTGGSGGSGIVIVRYQFQ